MSAPSPDGMRLSRSGHRRPTPRSRGRVASVVPASQPWLPSDAVATHPKGMQSVEHKVRISRSEVGRPCSGGPTSSILPGTSAQISPEFSRLRLQIFPGIWRKLCGTRHIRSSNFARVSPTCCALSPANRCATACLAVTTQAGERQPGSGK